MKKHSNKPEQNLIGSKLLPNGGHSSLTLPLPSLTTLYDTCFYSSSTSGIFLQINLFTEKKVFSGLTTACRFAIWPTSRSPLL